jgi:hypothetical protein
MAAKAGAIVSDLLEALTFGICGSIAYHLACANALTRWADWLIDVSGRLDAGGVQES